MSPFRVSFFRAYVVGTTYAPAALGVFAALLALAEAVAHARGATPLSFGPAATTPPLFGHGSTAPVGMGASTPGTPAGPSTVVVALTGPGADPGGAALRLVAFGLLALATTVPVVFLRTRPTAAALVVGAAGVLSFTAFRTLTVAARPSWWSASTGSVSPERGGLASCSPRRTSWRRCSACPPGPCPEAWRCSFPWRAKRASSSCSLRASPRLRPWPESPGGPPMRPRTTGPPGRSSCGTLLEHTARGERARIARELHDVVAHHISMVAVQAETARVAVPGMPSAGAERLRAIGDTARSALTEMRRLLGVLREDDRERAADLRPQPGLRLTELNALLDEARDASGTAVRLVLSGSPAVLDPGVELAAYRIIQEALTNARRHAPGAAVDVELHYTRDALRLRVRDNGPGIPFSSGTATGTGGSDGLGVPGGAVMPGAAVPSGDARVPDGMAGHGFAEHESATRGPAGRVLAGQESAGHESAGHTFAGHGLADHESARYEAARHGLTEHESAARGSALPRIDRDAGTGRRRWWRTVHRLRGSGGFVVEACLPRLPDADDFQASGAADGPDRWWGPAAPMRLCGRMSVTGGTPIRVVVADDHLVVRTGFAELLGSQPDFAVVATAPDGAQAVRMCRELRPDGVVGRQPPALASISRQWYPASHEDAQRDAPVRCAAPRSLRRAA